MTYLTFGQFNIPIAWLAFFIAVFYSDFRSRNGDEGTNKLIEHSLYLYIIVWKLSYILFSASDFMKAPLSLIYFDGGLKGHILGLIVVTMVLYRKRHIVMWENGWSYWARLVAVFHLIQYSFSQQWLIVILWLIMLISIEMNKSKHAILGQFFLLIWLDGFISSFTFIHIAVLISVYWKTKQAQYLAIAGVFSLVAMMLVDIENKPNTLARAEINLPTTTGTNYNVVEQEQGLTIVNFFAKWCPPCKAEMPHLQNFAEELPNGVALIGINLTARDNGEEALSTFMDTYDVTYPILLDESDAIGKAFQVLSIPTTVILNDQGEELERIVGPVSEDMLRQRIDKYQTLLED